MADPLVTVLITAYNTKPEYLNEAVESAITQDYPNLEVLLIDDGSNPKLSDCLKRKDHPRLRYQYIDHLGIPFSLIRGMIEAKGEYVAILDHDDIMTEHSVRLRAEKLVCEHVGLVYGDIGYIDKQGRPYGTRHYKDYPDVDSFCQAVMSAFFPPLKHSGIMFDRNAVLNVGNYDSNLRSDYDNDLCIKVAKAYGFSHLGQIVVQYRTYDRNVSIGSQFLRMGFQSKNVMIDRYVHGSMARSYHKLKAFTVGTLKLLLRNYKSSFVILPDLIHWQQTGHFFQSKGRLFKMLNHGIATSTHKNESY
jgi:glycosyltransferase involved in cell wall biosynthesis